MAKGSYIKGTVENNPLLFMAHTSASGTIISTRAYMRIDESESLRVLRELPHEGIVERYVCLETGELEIGS